MNRIGIRHEDKYELERRTPITPEHIAELRKKRPVEFLVQTSEKRVFRDEEYERAGAAITNSLDDCDVVFGVKEMPADIFRKNTAYIFFSHVIKGQPYNMPMLKSLMDAGATLIDYEKIENDAGRRLIFFGRYAGLAGMINSLWTTGQRLKELGFDTPLGGLKQAYQYTSLKEAKDAVRSAGRSLEKRGMPDELDPFVIAVTGAGNVAMGALEILNLLPCQEITAQQLKDGDFISDTGLAAINLTVNDYIEHKRTGDFELMHYIDHPEEYQSKIESYLPRIDLFVNGLYWDERYPRLVTKKWLKRQHSNQELRLKVIGDVTCDIHGSIECTETATPIEEPVFMYNIESDTFQYGFEGEGIAVMAVDILPSELPKDSSEHFSSSLMPFLYEIANADFTAPLSELDLSDALKRALIVYRGELTPNFEYLRAYLP